jgi:hypothetical protein
MDQRRMIGVFAAAGMTWITATVLLATGDWYLACKQDGQSIGGIDCLQYLPGSAQAGSEPASSVGFVPLTLAWATASLVLLLLLFLSIRRRVR